MAGSSPHQASPHQVEFANVHQPDDFLELECKRDKENYQEGSVHTIHTGGIDFQRKGHVSHKRDDDKAMQREIDDLKNNSVEHNRSDPLPALMSPPTMKKTLYTDRDLEPHQANPSPVRKSIFIEGNAEALLAKE